MNAIARSGPASQIVSLTLFLLLTCAAPAQEHLPRVGQNGNWDFSVWIAGATGEETRNSFTQGRQSLDVGCRWLHISNANLGVRNPEFNGVEISLGYHWFK